MNIDEARYKPILLNKPTGWSESWKGIENIPLLVIGVMKSNHVEAVSFAKLALKYDVDFNTPFVDGMSLFMMLVAIGHTHAAKEILNSGRKIDMAQVMSKSVDHRIGNRTCEHFLTHSSSHTDITQEVGDDEGEIVSARCMCR